MRSRLGTVALAAAIGSIAFALCMGASCQLSDVLAFQSSPSAGQQSPPGFPLAVTCPGLVHACTLTDSADVVLSAHITRTDATALVVAWTIDNAVVHTQSLPGSTPLDTDVTLTQSLALGSYHVIVTVNDSVNPVVSCETTLEVIQDKEPPKVICSVEKSQLWPPNHKLVDVGLSVNATDDCDLDPEINVAVYSDEDVNGKGDGNTSQDAELESDELKLLEERSGTGDGRVYLIIVTATDDVGRQIATACSVTVPHDQGAASISDVQTQAEVATQSFTTDGQVPSGFTKLVEGRFENEITSDSENDSDGQSQHEDESDDNED